MMASTKAPIEINLVASTATRPTMAIQRPNRLAKPPKAAIATAAMAVPKARMVPTMGARSCGMTVSVPYGAYSPAM